MTCCIPDLEANLLPIEIYGLREEVYADCRLVIWIRGVIDILGDDGCLTDRGLAQEDDFVG